MQPNLAVLDRLRSFNATPKEDSVECDKKCANARWLEEPWLREGPAIVIRSLHVAYGESQEVLKDFSLELCSNQKLGIHGGPGTGKSALLFALLRLLPPRQGSIYFDDVDVSQISLKTLRKALGFLPKESFLFQGTVRFNLDPLSEHTSDEIFAALRSVGLERLSLESKVHVSSEANGRFNGNFLSLSAGEKRLLALARMLLRQPALLLLDEIAGCDVDRHNRNLIQQVVLSSFPRSTIIAVSRLADSFTGFDNVAELRCGSLSSCSHTSDSRVEKAMSPGKQHQMPHQLAVGEIATVGG
jgi:ABC-type multidrug transport system fused ATPase/permease subunit